MSHQKRLKLVRVNLGSGTDKFSGFTNVDINEPADIIHDLNQYPWPFKNSEVSEIRAWHIIEHLDDPVKAMKEIWRVCKNGSSVEIRIPDYKNEWQTPLANPEHKYSFMPRWFEAWDERRNNGWPYKKYSKRPKEKFRVLKIERKYNFYRRIKLLKGVWPLTSKRFIEEYRIFMQVAK